MVIDVGDLTEEGREHPGSIQPLPLSPVAPMWHFAWRPSSSSFLGRRASKASAETKTSSVIVTQRKDGTKNEEENNQRCSQNPALSKNMPSNIGPKRSYVTVYTWFCRNSLVGSGSKDSLLGCCSLRVPLSRNTWGSSGRNNSWCSLKVPFRICKQKYQIDL